MAWTTNTDFTTGRVVTASDWNAEMGTTGNMSLTATGLASAAGQVPYATGTNALAMLALGSAGTFLGVSPGATAPAYLSTLEASDAVTAAVTNVLTLDHRSSGTPAANYGTGLLLRGKSSTTNNRDMAAIQTYWATATDASRSSAIALQAVQGANALSTKLLLTPTAATLASVVTDYDVAVNTTSSIGSFTGPKFVVASNDPAYAMSMVLALKGTAGATTHVLGGLYFYGLNGGSTVVAQADIFAQLDGATNKTKIELDTQNGASSNTLVFNSTGQLNINGATNAKMTTGLTIQQGGADDEIQSWKSTDVAHGMTTATETDTYGFVKKQSATNGGLRMEGYSAGTAGIALVACHTTDDTTKATSSSADYYLNAGLKSGTTTAAIGSTANLLALVNGGTTEFIFRGDGTPYQHAGTAWTNFDDHDDVALLTAASAVVSRRDDPFAADWRDLVKQHRKTLEGAGLVVINDGPGEDGSVFWSLSGFIQLAVGGVRQVGGRVADLERRLDAALSELTAIKQHPALARA